MPYSQAPRGLPKLFARPNTADLTETKPLYRLGIKVNTPDFCNWRCPYCYAGDETLTDRPRVESVAQLSPARDPDWSTRMIGWIRQGIGIGVRSVNINGTFEPLMAPGLWEVIEFCRGEGLAVALVTNGELATEQSLRRLLRLQVRVLTKISAPLVDRQHPLYDECCRAQRFLSGKPGDGQAGFERQKRLIQMMMDLGFNAPPEPGLTWMGVESVVARRNVHLLPLLIRQLRETNVYAHIEILKVQGYGRNAPDLGLTRNELHDFFVIVRDQDIHDGFTSWPIQPPTVGGSCLENRYRVDIHADGKVYPCPGIDTALGDLNTSPLLSVLDHETLRILRSLDRYIEGDCASCEQFREGTCLGGCRGTAFQTLTSLGYSTYQGLVASDPSCPKVKSMLDEGTSSSLYDSVITTSMGDHQDA
jgi:radical SAM protein with 4Fe4S-binding SPASM domain